ncbi:MAG: HAD-IA family hydrolase [Nitrososphaerota archaeon]|jgi:putative hydrolase of the HAD superfamily|nr:HAD-IA family hydrolase [Nitrososphaerota archaeon]
MLRTNQVCVNNKFGVLFDFDGTLIDSFTYRHLAHVEVAKILTNFEREHGLDVSEERMVSILSELENEMTAKLVYDRKIWFSEAIKRHCGLSIAMPVDVCTAAVICYWETIIRHSFLYPNVTELLVYLKKYASLGIVSDTDGFDGMKSRRIQESGIQEFFDDIIVSGENVNELKPSKQPFVKICQLLDVLPANCVYIGDNPNVDIIGAKELEMKTIMIKNSHNHQTIKTFPDFFLNRESFSQIKLLIESCLNIKFERDA